MAIQKITSGIIQDGAIAAADIVSVANTAITGNITSSQIAPDQTLNGNVSVTGTLSTPNTFGFKNRIINGAMVIDQRNAGASKSYTALSSAAYSVDRWRGENKTDGAFTIQQLSTVPTGFINSLGVTITSADASIGATQYSVVEQPIEGLNVADLGFGTASASTITLSFKVYSSLTGTFGGALSNSAQNRSYPFSYSIPAANTWTTISITVAGDTTGTWLTTSGVGLLIIFSLGTGSTYSGTAGAWAGATYLSATGATSVVGTNGATFYITGVQLEKGSTATSFDFRDYGRELIMCQRYAYGHVSSSQVIGPICYYNATRIDCMISFPTTMRTTPSLTATSGANCYLAYRNGNSDFVNSITINDVGLNGCTVYNNSEASGTAGDAGWLTTQAASVLFSAEL